MFRELQARQTAFSGLAGSYSIGASAAYNNTATNGRALLVSGNYFQVLGVGSAVGRVFDENDDRTAGGQPLVVLSHGYWSSRFGADPGLLDQTMIVNGRAMTVIGVAPQAFSGEMPGSPPDIFIPISMKKEMTPDWDALQDRKDYSGHRCSAASNPAARSNRRRPTSTLRISRSCSRTSRCCRKPATTRSRNSPRNGSSSSPATTAAASCASADASRSSCCSS